MRVKTRYFEEIDCAEEEIIQFPCGIYGFEDMKQCLIIRFEEENDSLLCLQSVTDANLAFIALNPYDVCDGYAPKLDDEDLKTLKAKPTDGMLIYVLASIKENGSITANLKSPIVVNPVAHIAKQVILEGDVYSMRYPVATKA